jgi:hypothetical protein
MDAWLPTRDSDFEDVKEDVRTSHFNLSAVEATS